MIFVRQFIRGLLWALMFGLFSQAAVMGSVPCVEQLQLTEEDIEVAGELGINLKLLAQLKAKPLYKFTEKDVDIYLRYLQRVEPNLRRRVVHLGRKNIGQPYQIFLLGEFPFELYDPDPLYYLGKSDCVTFSEHTYAMALAHDWPSFFRILQDIRYKDGKIGMLTRNHFTLADWNVNNSWLVEDVTKELGGGNQWVPLFQVTRRARFFARWNIGQDIPDQEWHDSFIPRENVPNVLAYLRDGDFVNVIRGTEHEQWAGHVGLIALAPDGTVNFLHSEYPAVLEEPLMGYLERKEGVLGFKFLRLRAEELERRFNIYR